MVKATGWIMPTRPKAKVGAWLLFVYRVLALEAVGIEAGG